MPRGIRATVVFSDPSLCPLTALSKAAETTIDSVTTNVCSSECTERVTEFSMDTDCKPGSDLEPIFSHGSTLRYRITHNDGLNCPCECLGQFGCPVSRYVAHNGTLTLVFHSADYEELEEVVDELRERFPEVDIKRFVRSPAKERSRDSVFIDRSKLTHRQLQVLETAYEMGYFERPRRANATEIAAKLDITPSTFSEHLAATTTKILEDFL